MLSSIVHSLLVVIMACIPLTGTAQETSRPIGFSLQVATDGIFSATVSKAEVANVMPDSQAQAAGIRVGDELVRVQGVAVPGGDGSKLKPLMEFVVGEPKRLTFKRKDGSQYEVILTKAKS
jgi:C-terminal processing protease CtpA/Prc